VRAEPRSFQADAVQHHIELLRSAGASAEGSVPGFGKTFVAAFVARDMGHELVVCCPRVVIPHWRAAAEAAGTRVRCISNYEQHKLGHTGMGEWVRKPSKFRDKATGKVKKSSGGTWRWTFPKPTLLVIDEAHYCKSRASQNAKLVVAAKRQGIPTLPMSATLAVDPTDLYAVGYLLGLHDGDFGWDAFQSRFGVLPIGFEKKFCPNHDPTALARLNAELFPRRGHRKTYDEIPGFPPEHTDVRAVEAEPAALEAMEQAWVRVKELEALHETAETSGAQRTRARQLAELAKVPAIVDLARDLLASGLSVPIFLNYHDSIDAVAEALKVPRFDGRTSDGERARIIAAFQDDVEHCTVFQTGAGGIGISLHDTRGMRPRHSIISPGDDSRAFVQALGRNRRVGQKSPAFRTVLTLANSIEGRVHRALSAKVGQIDTINDGDLDPLAENAASETRRGPGHDSKDGR
jgi:superfamily II DNA or RNA helicase